jgi:hypothetical protein
VRAKPKFRGLDDGPPIITIIWIKCDFCLCLGKVNRAKHRVGRLYACKKHYEAAPIRKYRSDKLRGPATPANAYLKSDTLGSTLQEERVV